MKLKAKKHRWIFGSLACLLLLPAILFAWTAKQINDFSDVRSTATADAAIVLGAAVWVGKPSPVLQERVNQAVRLYRAKQVRKIIFTGGQSSGNTVSEAVASKQFAIEQGIPDRDLLVEDQSKSTYENLVFAKELASRSQLKSFLVVSDPLHMRRALDIAADLKMDAQTSPTTTSRYVSSRSRRQFLFRETYYLLKYRLYERIFDRPPPLHATPALRA